MSSEKMKGRTLIEKVLTGEKEPLSVSDIWTIAKEKNMLNRMEVELVTLLVTRNFSVALKQLPSYQYLTFQCEKNKTIVVKKSQDTI